MKFSDWAPIIVAVVSLVGVLVVPALTGNRPKQQLEALKAVREGITSTDDEHVKAALLEAERGLADRLKARYSASSVRLRRRRNTLIAILAAQVLTALGYVLSFAFIGKDAVLTQVALWAFAVAAGALYVVVVVWLTPALWGATNKLFEWLAGRVNKREPRDGGDGQSVEREAS